MDVPGYAGIPFTSEQIAAIEVTNDKSRYSRRVLTRYWFPLHSHFGIGVTAYSLPEARAIAQKTAEHVGWPQPDAATENIDVRTLDQNHVIPNMSPVSNRGVWYPVINL